MKLFPKRKKRHNRKNSSTELPNEFLEAMKNAPEEATIICCNFIYSTIDEYNNAILTNYKNDDKKIVGSMPYTVVFVPGAAKDKYFDYSSFEGRFYFREHLHLIDEMQSEDNSTENNIQENDTDDLESDENNITTNEEHPINSMSDKQDNQKIISENTSSEDSSTSTEESSTAPIEEIAETSPDNENSNDSSDVMV